MIGTPIEWADDTVNPVMGCDGCELRSPNAPEKGACYAGVLTDRRAGHPGYPTAFENVTLFPGRMAVAARQRDLRGQIRLLSPWRNRLRRLIFVSDMGDALSKKVSFAYLATEIVDGARSQNGARHEWLWLTKQPKRMAEFSAWLARRRIDWPPNVWAGTSITSTTNVGRVDPLLDVGDASTTRFLSIEPQRGPIDASVLLGGVDWVIQGGESGKRACPFDLAWAHDLREACRASGTAYFLKQLGARPVSGAERVVLRDRHGGDWSEWSPDLQVREFPSRVHGQKGGAPWRA
jgi:protein gp37